MIATFLLASAFALASPAPAAPAPSTTIEAALVRGEGVELAEVERALRVRLPSLALVERGEDLPPGTGVRAFVELRRTSPSQVQIALILSDGRAYFRTVDTEGEAPARPVAGALALLIAAIEDDSVAPDERDVPVPPAIVAEPAPARPEPAVPVTPPACPEVPTCPQPAAPPPPPVPALELGPVLSSGAAFGLGGVHGGVRGWQLLLGLDVRWRRGAIAALEVRTLVAPVDRYTLARVRVAAGGGFALRAGRFELPIVGLVGVEWWGIPGGAAFVQRPGGAPVRPLVGGGLRLSPGFGARFPAAALRAGVRVELWGSGEPGPGGPSQPVIARPGELSLPLAAVGGAELSVGLELALWFAPGGRKKQETGPK